MDYTELWSLVEAHREDLVVFAQRLVQTHSMPGQEAQVAAMIQAEMEGLGYDKVWLDEVGNVVGRIEGGAGASLMFNGHMDHVDAGDPERWPHPPFGGEIHDGELWGRGAVDMKGALAAMVFAAGLAKKLGRPLGGDLYVSAVVQEEVGGLGARHLARTMPVERVIIGEASDNHLRRGHRGRVELGVHLYGRSVHASMPDLGINPHFSMARFVAGLRAMEMAADRDYGVSTVAPTRAASEPESANVTPSDLHLVLDWRNVPGESPNEIVAKVDALLKRSLESGCQGRVEIATKELVSHTGFRMGYLDTFPSFTTPVEHPWLVEAQTALEAALGRRVEVGTWPFATDGGHFAAAGTTVLGFGPGDDAVVHTVKERLPIEQLVESVVGYMALGLTCWRTKPKA
jgi:putative selenium metabolism hydrolase